MAPEPKSIHSPFSRRTLLTGLAAGTGAYLLGDAATAVGAAAQEGGKRLPRTSPEAVGVDPRAVLAFIEAVEKKPGGLHSLMLLRKGQVVAEGWWDPYGPRYRHMLYSLSKSFTSTAIGLAVAEGRLTVEQPVVSFFPSDVPSTISPNLAAMQVQHLLMMGTGHDKDTTGPVRAAADGNWVKAFLGLPVEHAPASKFVYNSGATYMLSAIVQKLTGSTVLDYLQSRLFRPLGIEDPTWESCPRGINTGGWGLAVRTEDIAKFGQLYLQKGEWQGKQLVPASWVEQATSKKISNGTDPKSDWAQGYCYQIWRCRNNAYRGDGAFGQYCVVMPDQESVLAITSGLGDMQAVLTAAWDHLLPGLGTGTSDAGKGDLKKKLESLALTTPEGQPTSATAKRVSGKTITFETNATGIKGVVPTFKEGHAAFKFQSANGDATLECGQGKWLRGTALLPGATHSTNTQGKVAARGGWQDENTYVATLAFYETPYIQTTTWKFEGDTVTVSSKANVGFGPTQLPTLTGKVG